MSSRKKSERIEKWRQSNAALQKNDYRKSKNRTTVSTTGHRYKYKRQHQQAVKFGIAFLDPLTLIKMICFLVIVQDYNSTTQAESCENLMQQNILNERNFVVVVFATLLTGMRDCPSGGARWEVRGAGVMVGKREGWQKDVRERH
ncbi:hypothetical protein CBL_05304 [Carabus blaptoides fortunei]